MQLHDAGEVEAFLVQLHGAAFDPVQRNRGRRKPGSECNFALGLAGWWAGRQSGGGIQLGYEIAL